MSKEEFEAINSVNTYLGDLWQEAILKEATENERAFFRNSYLMHHKYWEKALDEYRRSFNC